MKARGAMNPTAAPINEGAFLDFELRNRIHAKDPARPPLKAVNLFACIHWVRFWA